MSRFFSSKFDKLTPYTPGEQPKDQKYVKLNTNESPFPPSDKAIESAIVEAKKLMLYPDPDCTELRKEFAKVYNVNPEQVVFSNGSDDLLNFAFMAYCDDKTGAQFPDITYGFYPVFSEFNNIAYTEVPLKDDFTIDIDEYKGVNKTIFIANPNAPTGITLSLEQIEEIVKSNPDNIVVIDEAYVDFGGTSAFPLVDKYENILVIGTFSKSRSLAGGRLGFAYGPQELINDLNTIRYSTNPYNINRVTLAMGIGIMRDNEYTLANCQTIIKNREYTIEKLEELGFTHTDSKANFIFVKNDKVSGQTLYEELKKRGVLVRHFNKERITDYLRITIGTKEEMDILIEKIKEILLEV